MNINALLIYTFDSMNMFLIVSNFLKSAFLPHLLYLVSFDHGLPFLLFYIQVINHIPPTLCDEKSS